jgi:ubiquinone biosynthesis monooxygenase Coq7
MTTERHYSAIDRALMEVDHAARTVIGRQAGAARPYPAEKTDTAELTAGARRLSAGLMRVNHAGEVSAQALYRGQGAVARQRRQREQLLRAADEEQDHLAWCARRLKELDGTRSRLDGLWYAGSFAIGALAGLAGDRHSLGFVSETEAQVERHLDEHLGRLPADDTRSRAVLKQMQDDEIRHGRAARQAGGKSPPRPIKWLMRRVSKLMTSTAFWI